MNIQPRWIQRFENYNKAVDNLNDAVIHYANTDIDLLKDGIIKRFELAHELAWKLMKDLLQAEGESEEIRGLKSATRLAFSRGYIHNGQIWMDMINSRNLSVHIYNEAILETEFGKIVTLYLPLLLQFRDDVMRQYQVSGE